MLNGAIATGSLDDVLPGLVGASQEDYTITSFWERFRDEYCKPRLASWKRYRLSFDSINAYLGNVPLRDFRREHLHGFVERRTGKVSASTINKDIAAIKKMFSYALEVGAVQSHPLVRFPKIRTQEVALRLPTLEEFYRLIDSMADPAIGALVAILGETGIRKSEGINLQWSHIDWQGRRLIVEITKSKKVRTIPLSDHALDKLRSLVRFVHQQFIFCHQDSGKRWFNPDKVFRAGRKAAGLPWITFHTLRHFRGTSWLQLGADIRTVQMALGHADIQTTLRYLKWVESHSDKAIREAQEKEKAEIESRREIGGRTGNGKN